MESTNVLIDSYLQIIQAEFFHEIALMYEKHRDIQGDKFEGLMITMEQSIEGLRADCKPGTSFIEAGLLMLSCSLEEESKEDNIFLNELTKACIEWKRRKDSAQLKGSFVPCSEN